VGGVLGGDQSEIEAECQVRVGAGGGGICLGLFGKSHLLLVVLS
jgi:hypothetical protein